MASAQEVQALRERVRQLQEKLEKNREDYETLLEVQEMCRVSAEEDARKAQAEAERLRGQLRERDVAIVAATATVAQQDAALCELQDKVMQLEGAGAVYADKVADFIELQRTALRNLRARTCNTRRTFVPDAGDGAPLGGSGDGGASGAAAATAPRAAPRAAAKAKAPRARAAAHTTGAAHAPVTPQRAAAQAAAHRAAAQAAAQRAVAAQAAAQRSAAVQQAAAQSVRSDGGGVVGHKRPHELSTAASAHPRSAAPDK